MRVGYYVFNSTGAIPTTIGNRVFIDDTQFFYNEALNGGGLSVSPALQNGSESLGKISVTNSVFSHNRARLGAAMHISKFTVITSGYMLRPHFENCTFESNTVVWYYMNKSCSGSMELLNRKVLLVELSWNSTKTPLPHDAAFKSKEQLSSETVLLAASPLK